MQTPRYQAAVDLSNDNMSQALIARMVGAGKRVLDVGCATGYIAEVLRELGCSVSGIEYDADTGEQARPYLDKLVIGDVERVDLVAEFGAGCFDVVIYGDVLEHLVDPVAVLVKTRDLLARGGAVVASIPNVAHGAVRLSLLAGEFAYRETGLLDNTHLRFFTAATVGSLFRDAGYTPVELRRTRIGVFETEIGVRAGDFPPAVVDLVLDDPEATTYQFVVAAVPGQHRERYVAVQAAEEQRLAEHLRSRAASKRERGVTTPGFSLAPGVATVPGTAPALPCRLGIAAALDADRFRDALLVRLTVAELCRRLPAASVRLFSPYGTERSIRVDPGAAAEALGWFGATRARELAGQLDALVVTGTVPTDPAAAAALYAANLRPDAPALFLSAGLAAAGPAAPPTVWSAVELTAAPVEPLSVQYAGFLGSQAGVPDTGEAIQVLPDPGILAPRLFEPAILQRRLSYLRVIGQYPQSGPVLLVHGDGRLVEHTAAVAAVLDRLQERHPTLGVVVAEFDPPRGDGAFLNALTAHLLRSPRVLTIDAGLDDLVAVLAAADAVVSSAATVLAVARAYGGRTVALDLLDDPSLGDCQPAATSIDVLAERLDDLGELLELPSTRRRRPASLAVDQGRLDDHFDRVARIVADAAAGRGLRPGWGVEVQPAEDLARRVAGLERARAAMRTRANAERSAMADALAASTEPVIDHYPELIRVRAELAALRNSRTLRVVRPARAVYARLRGHRL